MSTRLVAAAAAFLFVLGAVVQIWLPRTGLTFMLLGVMAAVASILLMQRMLQKRLIKHERFLLKVQESVTTGTKKIHSGIAAGNTHASKQHSSILNQVKLLRDLGVPTAPASGVGKATSAPVAAAPGVGRASTPEVDNPFTDETLHSMLTPGRRLKVAGVFEAGALPAHETHAWVPGEVVASLERVHPDLIVIDEKVLRESPVWSVATSSVGTALMQELRGGVAWAETHRLPAYLLPAALAPDVHSAALRNSWAVTLPLDDEATDAAAGGPSTALLQRLSEIAANRAEGAA